MRQDTSYVPTLFVQWTILLASNQFFNLVTYHFSQMLCYILLSTHIVVPKTDITINRLMISYSGCKQWYLNFNYIKRWAKKLRFLYNEDIMEIIDNLISSHKLSPMSLPNTVVSYIYQHLIDNFCFKQSYLKKIIILTNLLFLLTCWRHA